MAGHASTTLVAELNRLANGGTYPASPSSYLDEAGAANAWAGTVGLETVGALNHKAATSGLALDGVCNSLAGTSGLGCVEALRRVAS